MRVKFYRVLTRYEGQALGFSCGSLFMVTYETYTRVRFTMHNLFSSYWLFSKQMTMEIASLFILLLTTLITP